MNIVILSRNASLYSTRSLVDAARIRNHYVRVIDHMACDLIIESNRCKIIHNNQELNKIDAVIPRIGSTATIHGAAVIRQFENQNVFTTLGANPLLAARDKLSCLQVLSGHGISVPKTIFCSNSYTIPFLLDAMEPYPVVIKLVTGTQGLGVILAENKNNAESILEAFHTTKEKVILQKYIKEARGADIRAFVVDGKIVAAMKRQSKPGDFRSNLHRGGIADKISLSSQEEETALRSVHALGLKVAGVDMLQSHNGPCVLEVNASPGLEGIETISGVNVSKSIIEFIEKNRK